MKGPLAYVGWRAVVFVVALLALELVLGQLGYGKWVVTERTERFGWALIPNQRGWSRDLTIPERINSYGFRDREWEEPERADGGWAKDAGLYRVAVVGNSMTYGSSVAVEDTYARVLEELLAAELDRRGDPREALVMNFAVQGYSLEQMARTYEDKIRPFRPDLLIFPVHTGDLMPMAPSTDDFDYRYRRVYARTATRDWLTREVTGNVLPRPPKREPEGPVLDLNAIKIALRDNPRDPSVRPYLREAAERMTDVHRRLVADGGRLLIVTLPLFDHLLAEEENDAHFLWEAWRERRLAADPDAPRPSLLKPLPAFREAQADLTEVFREMGAVPTDERGMKIVPPGTPHAEQSLFLPEDLGHYSPRGHRLLAERIHDRLVADGLFP